MQAIRIKGLGPFLGLGALSLLGWGVFGASLGLPPWKAVLVLAAPLTVPPALAAATLRVSQEDLEPDVGEVLEIESVDEDDEEEG